MRNIRLPARGELVLRSFGILSSVGWYFLIDVSGKKPINPVFKGHLALEGGLDNLSRNVGEKLPS